MVFEDGWMDGRGYVSGGENGRGTMAAERTAERTAAGKTAQNAAMKAAISWAQKCRPDIILLSA